MDDKDASLAHYDEVHLSQIPLSQIPDDEEPLGSQMFGVAHALTMPQDGGLLASSQPLGNSQLMVDFPGSQEVAPIAGVPDENGGGEEGGEDAEGRGRRRRGNYTRGPMDNMRQLMRIIQVLFPSSVKFLGGVEGNRASEGILRKFFDDALGEAPKPTWGLPDHGGWIPFIQSLLQWGRQAQAEKRKVPLPTITFEMAGKVAERLPGRSWSLVASEMVAMGVDTRDWHVPLKRKQVASLKDPRPLPPDESEESETPAKRPRRSGGGGDGGGGDTPPSTKSGRRKKQKPVLVVEKQEQLKRFPAIELLQWCQVFAMSYYEVMAERSASQESQASEEEEERLEGQKRRVAAWLGLKLATEEELEARREAGQSTQPMQPSQ